MKARKTILTDKMTTDPKKLIDGQYDDGVYLDALAVVEALNKLECEDRIVRADNGWILCSSSKKIGRDIYEALGIKRFKYGGQ